MSNLIKNIDLYDLSPNNIQKSEQRFDNSNYCIHHYAADLNFIELPKEKYDFILCKFALHHIVSLEYLLCQVNYSLM